MTTGVKFNQDMTVTLGTPSGGPERVVAGDVLKLDDGPAAFYIAQGYGSQDNSDPQSVETPSGGIITDSSGDSGGAASF